VYVLLVQISKECTTPYLSTGISNLLQPAQAEVVLGQPSTYLASWVYILENMAPARPTPTTTQDVHRRYSLKRTSSHWFFKISKALGAKKINTPQVKLINR
jgi:hypothetical protein